jgi:polyisoprenoid-binding protein YceI
MLLTYIIALLFLHAPADVAEYHVDRDSKNMVKFISDAPVEDFEGVTGHIDGYLLHEGKDLYRGSEVYLEVDLRTLDTGIELRNQHMRDNYLETDTWPRTWYKGAISNTWTDREGLKAKVKGTIFIHGVERELTVVGLFLPTENGYRIRTSFEVKLTDFDIEVPQLMFMKIDEVMQLELDFYIKRV